MIEKLIKPAFIVKEELKKTGIEEDIIEILLYYYQLKDTFSH